MHEIILCKLGEVVLKGLNRRSFEMKLMSNIRRRTQPFGKFKIYSRQSTIYVEPVEDACDIAGAYAACKQVFGIIAITAPCPARSPRRPSSTPPRPIWPAPSPPPRASRWRASAPTRPSPWAASS